MKILLIFLLMVLGSYADTLLDDMDDKKDGLSGHIRFIHVLHGKDNGFDPETGSTVGLNLRYRTKSFYGLQANIGFHYVGDTSLTDFSRDSSGKYNKKIASGLFLTSDFSSKAILDEANIVYRFNDEIMLKVGRRSPPETLPFYIASPIALFKVSQVENSYEAASIHVKALDDTVVSVAQITKMMLGTRATSDYALIGEYTNTAGVAVNPLELRGEFIDIEKLAFTNGLDSNGKVVDTSGITMFSLINRSYPRTTIQFWNYYAYDIVNFFNLQVDKTISFKNIDTTLKFQYLKEDDIGDSLAGGIDATMYGVLANFKINPFVFSIAYNHSKGEFFNPWGFDSGFTSSLFSRNEYRDDVSAYKLGALYSLNSKMKVSISYANYGQSNSYGGNVDRTLYPTRDATEIDTVVSYKHSKQFIVKLLNVLRTSEYESSTSDRKQNQWRIIAQYKF